MRRGAALRLRTALQREWRRLSSRPRGLLALALCVAVLPFALSPRGGVSETALLPAFVTLASVLFTQRVIASMLLGCLVGSVLEFGPLLAAPLGARRYFIGRLLELERLYISGFAVSVLLTVKLTEASGGMRGVLAPIKRRLVDARSTQLGAGLLGLLVFFDDYANTLLVGPAMRPLCDQKGISREKLAYIVDSTAAPVAGLAIVSTWLGYEVGLLQAAANELGINQGGYALLLSALPGRFYCVFALVMVFLIALLGRDFGPMWRAERAARQRAVPAAARQEAEAPLPRWLWLNAAVPISVLFLGVVLGFALDGGGLAQLEHHAPWSLDFWRATTSASRNGPRVLFTAGLLGLGSALFCTLLSRSLDLAGTARALLSGLRTILAPLAILYCAWALGDVSRDLETGRYLVSLLRGEIPPWSVPVLTFLLAGGISFATGTSFGTMGILIPAALPLAFELGGLALLIPTIAAVLDGAIFGDHCSPLSDTTVLSSVASECSTISHTSTQLPYALTAMFAATSCYLLVSGAGLALPIAHALGAASLVATVRLLGRPPLAAAQTRGFEGA